MNMKKILMILFFVSVSMFSFGQVIHDRSYYSVKDSIEYRSCPSDNIHTLNIFYSADRKTALIKDGPIGEYNVYKTANYILFKKLNVLGEETNIILIYHFNTKLFNRC